MKLILMTMTLLTLISTDLRAQYEGTEDFDELETSYVEGPEDITYSLENTPDHNPTATPEEFESEISGELTAQDMESSYE